MLQHILALSSLLFAIISFAQAQSSPTLQGLVQDEQTAGIAGASVTLLNTTRGASTDSEGRYRITHIAPGQYTIKISAIGYATVTKTVLVTEEETELNVQLVEASQQLGQVTVTAQKREENLQQVPISITSLSASEVQAYRLWDIRDMAAIVPNLYAADPGDNRNVTSIRGITTTSYDPAVATYVDGVNQFNLDTYMPELLDVERIEVLRGPQGTLYGRNAMGGVINIITKEPTNELSGSMEASLANYGQQRYSASLRTPLLRDRLFLGVAGLFRKQDGFYTNQFDGSSFDRQEVGMGNYFLKYVASPRLNLTFNLKHSANRNKGAFPLVFGLEEAFANPFVLNQNAVGEMRDNTLNASLSVSYVTSAFNFTSQTAHQSNYRYYAQPIDGDFSPIDGVSIVNDYGRAWNRVRVQTQEFRISSPASHTGRLKWLSGVYGFYQQSPVKQGVRFGEDAEMMGAPFPNFTSININTGEGYGLALYGQGTYSLSPRFDLTAGLRYDYEHKEQRIRGEFVMGGEEAMVVLPDTASEASFKALSPRLSLAFHLSANHHLYGTFSRGFRAGGITQLSSDPSQPPLYQYDPEKSDNVELGLKSSLLENRLRLNVTAFYTRLTDAQVPVLLMPDAIVVTRNAGELKSKGVELELSSTLAKGLEAAYRFGYTDASYTSLTGIVDGEGLNMRGNRQVFTPDRTSMLALQYAHGLGEREHVKLVTRGEWHYVGTQYFDLANQLKQEGYSLLHARLGISSKKYEAFVWGRNLTDETYIAYAYDFGAARLGNPATYGLTIGYKY